MAHKPGKNIDWSFEKGLEGWTVQTGKLAPTCAPVTAGRLRSPAGGSVVPASIGGDYWQTPIDVGQDGACRIDTAGLGSVVVTSPEFTIAAPFLSLRLGSGGSRARVELQLKRTNWTAARTESGTDGLAMRVVTWDTHDLLGEAARLSIVDDGSGPGMLVDAFSDAMQAPAPAPAPLWGFADFHAHPVSQLGFGRHVVVGGNDGDIAKSLASCAAEHGDHGGGGKAGLKMALFEASYNGLPGHRPTGYPLFDGWPRYTTQTHQQMHVDWIRRAWEGGLRLMVAHAVSNEELAGQFHGTQPFGDQDVARAEIAEMTSLVGRHSDFMEIAKTPADARRIVGAGKLAIVLGVEVDALGGCRREEDCSPEKVRSTIDELFAAGVRHIFPIHLADNGFGGAAVYYGGVFNLLTWYIHDDYQHVERDDAIAFRFTRENQGLPAIFTELTHQKNEYQHGPYSPPFAEYDAVGGGHVNRLGLSDLGKIAVSEMMRLGMIVDIDHMGQRARKDTLELARASGMPVAMGHSWYRDLGYSSAESDDPIKLKNEAMKTAEEMAAVLSLGGAIAPITNQGDVRRVQGSGVGVDCAGASTSWLQAYAYAVERAGGAGVGMGTDFNGLAGEPGPRFGPFACTQRTGHDGRDDDKRRAPHKTMAEAQRSDANAQDHGVTYDSPVRDARTYRFFGPLRDAPYSHDERAIWIALAAFKAGVPPPGDELPFWEKDIAVRVAKGFADPAAQASDAWRAAAFLVKSGAPAPASPSTLVTRYGLVKGIWDLWERMGSGNPKAPLTRNLAGNRDFDVNLDGVAHYGLLPDFLQDVSNQLRAGGGQVHDLSALFRSAETYVQMWERATSAVATGASKTALAKEGNP